MTSPAVRTESTSFSSLSRLAIAFNRVKDKFTRPPEPLISAQLTLLHCIWWRGAFMR